MSKYQFGSIVNRDFRNTLQRLADDAAAQGKAIQDLVAEGQLTEEQYAELITVINGLLKSGHVDKSDLTSEFIDEIEGFSAQLVEKAQQSDLESVENLANTLSTSKADKSYVDNLTSSIANGSPKGVYATVADLRNAFPSGNNNIYVVQSNGNWYFWNGSWTAGGVYQGSQVIIEDKSITGTKLASNYEFKKELTTETLNTAYPPSDMLESGVYYTKTALTGKPPEASNNAIVVMRRSTNNTYGYFILEYHDIEDSFTMYRRIGQIGVSAGTWRKIKLDYEIPDKSITNSKLVDGILYQGRIEAGQSIDSVFVDGTYMVSGNNSGTYPDEYDNALSAFLEVNVINNRWVKQRLMPYNASDMIFERSIDKNTPTVHPWQRVITQNVLNKSLGGNPFLNKKIVCFGDSVTMNGNYPNRIAERLGATTYNVGFGGATWTTRGQDIDAFSMAKLSEAVATGDFSLQDANVGVVSSYHTFLNRLKGIDFNDVDYITTMYLGNDFTQGQPIGDDNSTNTGELKGAINHAINNIMTAYPHLKVALISSLWRHRFGETEADVDFTPNNAGIYFREYVDAIKERAQANHVPFLDLYRESGINKYNETTFLADRIHPTQYGYDHVGDKISAFLSATW